MRVASEGSGLTEEGRAFLQRRVSLFALVVGLIGSGFLAMRTVELVIADVGAEYVGQPGYYLHALGAGALLVLWLLLRTGKRSTRFVKSAETALLLLSCAAYQIMTVFLPETLRPEFVLIMALTITLVARAVYVPSSARRTLMLSIIIGLPMVPAAYWAYADADIDIWRPMNLSGSPETAHELALQVAWGTFVWWVPVVVVTTLASRVVYGLRREARKARQLGQYTLVEKLGEGGMGEVFRARHAMLRRPAAVKLLPPDKMGEASLARFEKEVQLTASLSHPNTVTIFDFGRTPDDIFYYAMELLDGLTLQRVVDLDGAQPPSRVVHVLAQVAGALAEAHGVGLIHRDIKPANIMLVRPGGVPDVAKVLDFGLVKDLAREQTASLTHANTITGTPQYIAPEAITAPDQVDARSDLYAVGAVGYFMLTGTHVFTGATVVEICSHHLHTAPERPSARLGAPVPEALEDLLLSCLAKKPGDRLPNAGALRDALLALDGVPEWAEADGAKWWSEHADEVRRSEPSDSGDAALRTFSVDVVHRGAAAPE